MRVKKKEKRRERVIEKKGKMGRELIEREE